MDIAVVFNRWRQCASPHPHLIHVLFRRPTRVPIPNDISTGSAVLAQITAGRPYTLQRAAYFLPQNCPFPWEIGTPSNA